MYARLTSLPFPDDARDDVHAFWTSEEARVIAGQPGFRASVILDCLEGEPRCVAVTMWDDADAFAAFYGGDHVAINAPLAATGMTVANRQAAEVVALTLPEPGEVRTIRLLIDPSEFEEVLEFWTRRGQALVQRQSGNLGAWALRDDESTEITLVFVWRTPEDGEQFLASSDHREVFGPGLGSLTQRVELRRWRPV